MMTETVKNILTNSFKFFVFEWKLFAIVLAFYLFKHFISSLNNYTSNDTTRQIYEMLANGISHNILYLFFWVSITPLIILSVKEFLTKKQRISFKRYMILRYFVPLFTYQLIFTVFALLMFFVSTFAMFNSTLIPEFAITPSFAVVYLFYSILRFILFLTPVIIVIENKTFIDGAKRSVEIIRNKLKECITFYLILVIVINFLFFLPCDIPVLYMVITGNYIEFSEYTSLRLILSSGWFIFYIASIVGFYLAISEDRKFGYIKQ